jgi:hypothetical protein
MMLPACDMMASTEQDDAKLAAKVVAAVKAYDAADAVKKEKAIIVGGLLAEAQKLHPSDKAFEAFLERAGGIHIRRAKDLIAIALGRTDFEKHQLDQAAAQQRFRDKQKAEKIEREKAKAALPKPAPKPDDDALRNASPKPDTSKWSTAHLREFESACRTFLPHLNKTDLLEARAFVELNKWQSNKQRKVA